MNTSPCLLLIDVQRGFDEPRWGRRNNSMAEANIARLLETWRLLGHPIVHVRHHSTEPQSPLHGAQPEMEATNPAALVAKPLAGKWSMLEIVEHLVLAERAVVKGLPDVSANKEAVSSRE